MPQRFTFSKVTEAPLASERNPSAMAAVVRAGVGERAYQHVAADARKCVQIADAHSVLCWRPCARGIFIILYAVARAPIIPYLG